MDEAELRRRAMGMLREGRRPGEVTRELGRSRQWPAKWRQRFDDAGPRGLREQSRASRPSPGHACRMVRAMLAARKRLTAHRGRQRFAGSGADAVAWELELAGVEPLPARRTIERILQRAGKTAHPARPVAPERTGGASPAPRAEGPGDLRQTDLVGPRHLRGPSGPLRCCCLPHRR